MDSTSSFHHLFLMLSLLSLHFVCSSASFSSPSSSGTGIGRGRGWSFALFSISNDKEMVLHPPPRKLRHHPTSSSINTIRHDFLNNPPITNPVTTPSTGGMLPFPPVTPTPTIVTVPSTTPTTGFPMNPPDVTNPVTTPQPVTNPVTSPTPTAAGGAFTGQSWCVAKGGVPDMGIQAGLDYACGIGGADCSAIQQGATCYNPNTLQYHASYAFNSYYQRNPAPTSCDFGGTAALTNVNPSTGSCVFTTSSPPATTIPTTDSSTGATPTSSGIPQTVNPGNPAAFGGGIPGGYGDNYYPPIGNSSSLSMSTTLRPFPFISSCIVVAATTSIIAIRNII